MPDKPEVEGAKFGRTWPDVVASFPVGAIALAMAAFVGLIAYASVISTRPVDLGFLGRFGPVDTRSPGTELPQGAVVAMNLGECPNGWSAYSQLQGRFIRGIDMTGAIDPDGQRNLGHIQEDAFQGHAFGNSDGRFLQYSETQRVTSRTNGFSDMMEAGMFGENAAYGPTWLPEFVEYDGFGIPRVAKETRPENVALLFCEKD